MLRYKACWYVRGFEQGLGVNYHGTLASVVRPMSYKALYVIAAALDQGMKQMGVKTALVYGAVEEAVYVDQPTRQEDGLGRVYRLKKALYGL